MLAHESSEVTLVREASSCRDLGYWELRLPEQANGPFYPLTKDVLMRGNPHRRLEDIAELRRIQVRFPSDLLQR